MFNDYKNVTEPLYEMPKIVREHDAVQDVDFPIDKVQKLDDNREIDFPKSKPAEEYYKNFWII